MRETTAAQCPIHPMETQPCPACLDALDNSMASYNTGYAAGYRAAQAAMPPREPTQTMLTAGWRCMGTTAAAWRAMYDAWQAEQTSGAAQAVTDDPAADHHPMQDAGVIALARIGLIHMHDQRVRETYSAVVDLAERLARENAELRNANSSFASNTICHGSRSNGPQTCPKAPCDYCLHWQRERAERAEDRIKELAVTAQREVDNALRSEAALERLRAENARLQAAHDHQYAVAGTLLRAAERAEAERDALREVVRELVACDDESNNLAAARLYGKPHMPEYKARELDYRQRKIEAWRAARAKVKP